MKYSVISDFSLAISLSDSTHIQHSTSAYESCRFFAAVFLMPFDQPTPVCVCAVRLKCVSASFVWLKVKM